MAKTKNRSFYIYITEIFTDKQHTHQNNYGWTTTRYDSLTTLFQLIKDLNLNQKTQKGNDDDKWTLKLDNYQKFDNYSQGVFSCTADGMHTKLFDNETYITSGNPKALTQNELMNTTFSLRAKDGLFVISEYQGNIATSGRLADYLNFYIKYFKDLGQLVTDIEEISFIHCVSDDFLDAVDTNFDRLNQAQITLKVPCLPDTSDGFSVLAGEVDDPHIGEITIALHKKDINGLGMNKVVSWFRSLTCKHQATKGIMKGHAKPGMQSKLSLKGINKVYVRTLEANNEGEVLLSKQYDIIEKINNESPLLF